MDYSRNGHYDEDQSLRVATPINPTPSIEPFVSYRTPKLQKKRSYAGLRDQSQHVAGKSGSNLDISTQGSTHTGFGDGAKGRKGSLRNAVRKMFGRKSRDLEATLEQPQLEQLQAEQPLVEQPVTALPRHYHHKSEPNALAPPPELPELAARSISPPLAQQQQRVLSAPLQINTSHNAPPRVRSPYAVEFPHSAKLKPLNLSAPFAGPNSPLRRRKTLPSMLLADNMAMVSSSSIVSTDAPPLPSQDNSRQVSTYDATATTVPSKRKSRSANDLKRALVQESHQRKRSDEIRYWRDSYQGSVLRNSAFVAAVPHDIADNRHGETKVSPVQHEDEFEQRQPHELAGRESIPSQYLQPHSEADMRSASGYGTELSRDIEERVAKLESGLSSFQYALTRLTAERNRRTVLIGNLPGQRRSSTDARTPSMLADSLMQAASINPRNSGYDFDESPPRPKTSPGPQPQTPRDSTIAMPPLPKPAEGDDPFTSKAIPDPAPAVPKTDTSQPKPPAEYTFKSLYEMLADERSARRRLETQLKGLRREIDDLHTQVTVNSNMQSQRSSYLIDHNGTGSSRLRELIRSTESSPPSSRSQQRDSGNTGFSADARQRVVSRFSISESEVGQAESANEEYEPETPHDLYLTPREERSGYQFSPLSPTTLRAADGGMF